MGKIAGVTPNTTICFKLLVTVQFCAINNLTVPHKENSFVPLTTSIVLVVAVCIVYILNMGDITIQQAYAHCSARSTMHHA